MSEDNRVRLTSFVTVTLFLFGCLFVCLSLLFSLFSHPHTRARAHTHTHTRARAHTHTYTGTRTHTDIHGRAHTQALTNARTCARTECLCRGAKIVRLITRFGYILSIVLLRVRTSCCKPAGWLKFICG